MAGRHGHYAVFHQQGADCGNNGKIPKHAAPDGEDVFFAGFEPPRRDHPQRQRHGKHVVAPGVENFRMEAAVVCPYVGDADQGSGGGKHGKEHRILPRQLKPWHKHQQHQNKVEVADLQHLQTKGAPADSALEGEPHAVAEENAPRHHQRGKNEANVLPESGQTGNHIHRQGKKRRRHRKKNQMSRVKIPHGSLRHGNGVSRGGYDAVFFVLDGELIGAGRGDLRETVDVLVEQAYTES